MYGFLPTSISALVYALIGIGGFIVRFAAGLWHLLLRRA